MTESYKAHLIDSLRFTRETVAGDATRSITFLFLCLCAGLSMSEQFFGIFTLWENILHIPYSGWGVRILLGTIIVLFWIALAGYGVRIFRGGSAPPSFTPVKTLMKDGLLVQVPLTLWLIPVYFFGAVRIGAMEILGIRISNLLWLAFYFLAPTICFLFANTGNVIESTRPLKILLTIKNSSVFFYAAVFLVFIAVSLVYFWIAWVLTLILAYILPVMFNPASYYAVLFFFSPIIMVFTARFFTNVLGKHTKGDSIGIMEVNKNRMPAAESTSPDQKQF